MTRTPTWFGPAHRPLFGWWHEPPGRTARAGIVFVPPLGAEMLAAHEAYRDLADGLASRGFLVLRFDLDGTGDSAGTLSDTRGPSQWREDISVAVAEVRRRAHLPVGLLGLRFGATLADLVAREDPHVDALVLWDPCPGNQFLREQRARHRLTAGNDVVPEGAVAGPSFLFPAPLVGAMTDVTFAAQDSGRDPVRQLILARPERRAHPALLARQACPQVSWVEVPGQDEFLDVSTLEAVVPPIALERITAWFDDVFAASTVRLASDPSEPTAFVETPPHALTVTERTVSLGDAGLFGIRTEPSEPRPGPIVVLLNVAAEHHIGPGRLWVELARRWAGEGTTVVRFDLSGIGDSPTRPGRTRDITYPTTAFDDIPGVAHSINPDNPADLLPVGMCSGAYHALEWAMHPGADAVCAINPILNFPAPELADGPVDPRRAMWLPTAPVAQSAGRTSRGSRLKNNAPPFLWRLLDTAGVYKSPTTKLENLVRRGADTLLICGDEDARPFQRSPWILDRLDRTGRFTFAVVPDADHSLQRVVARERVAALVSGHVARRRRQPAPVPAGAQ